MIAPANRNNYDNSYIRSGSMVPDFYMFQLFLCGLELVSNCKSLLRESADADLAHPITYTNRNVF